MLDEKNCRNLKKVQFDKNSPKIQKHSFYNFSTTWNRATYIFEQNGLFSPFWKLEISITWCIKIYIYIYIYVSWHKVLVWSLKNQWFLNFNCVLSLIKLAEGLEILLSWPLGIPPPMQLTLFAKSMPQHLETRLTMLLY